MFLNRPEALVILLGTVGIVMNKGIISTGFLLLHFRPPDKASGRLLGLILDSTERYC